LVHGQYVIQVIYPQVMSQVNGWFGLVGKLKG